MPTQVHNLVSSYLRGDHELSREAQFSLLEISDALFSEVSPIPVKAALAKMGKIENELRLPLAPLDPAREERLCAVLKKWELLA